ncbi:MAG: MBL fold metallo-hydrolase [Gluconacetobacter diazotrophicus]|nr:MBL fold metallo-hydrolase [Gluconacetobacter diazotrophicus]
MAPSAEAGSGRRRAWRLLEPEPERGVPIPAGVAGIRRIVAPNPGHMTYHGTNTWLVDWDGGTVAIDPGCEDAAHLAAVEREADGRLTHVLVTHTHKDHVGGAETLARRTGAALGGHRRSALPGFQAPLALGDGDVAAGLRVLETPGHAADHLCFERTDGVMFTGDHVMGWSTSVVPAPPAGDLAAFVRQLERVRDRNARLMLSGHGPAIEHPSELVGNLIDHRRAREAAILALLGNEPLPFEALLARAYRNLKPVLLPAARTNLMSHLCKLADEGRAVQDEQDGWMAAAG